MTKKQKKLKFPSELRFDLISKDWVVIATGRARKPEAFKGERRKGEDLPRRKCPFCKIEKQEKPVLIFVKGKKIPNDKILKNWTTIVVPNKYPAFLPYQKLEKKKEGKFYQKMNAVGFCEILVTRDHKKSMGQFDLKRVKEVIDAYQERYLSLMKRSFVNYVSIFHNHGAEAGASVSHPHSQIITTPLIDVDLKRALLNSESYYQKTKKCIYCQMNGWERRVKKRIVFENKKFLAVCPFASKSAFQVIISPKTHLPYFERIVEEEKWQLAETFREVLKKIYKGLADPAYNFYLHTAPCDGKDYPYYHWHWTILPKTSIWAGFELGARMEISTIEPEKAAEYLRKQ
jgi:UDPglucose--hexose-1-phosphate uridylyltransferase